MAGESELRRQDIISEDALEAPLVLARNLKEPLKVIDDLIKGFSEMGTRLKSSTTVGSARVETEKLTVAQQELLKVQKQIEITQAKNNDEYIRQQKVLKQSQQQLKDIIALEGRDAREVTALTASRKVLGAALEQNRRAYDQLTSEEERNSAEGIKLQKIIEQQTRDYDALSQKIGITKQNVGNYAGGILQAYQAIQKLKATNTELIKQQSTLNQEVASERVQYNNLTAAIQNNNQVINSYSKVIYNTSSKIQNLTNQILGAVGLVGAVYLVINAFKSFIQTNKEFEKSLSTLQALTGATAEELQFYREAAISIGAETKRSAKDVVESFKLIGGARPELLKSKDALAEVTRQSIILANAAGIELADAADATAGALNQLQLPAEEAARVVNTLAAGAKEGAAEIPDINAAFQEFGAVLKDSNGTVEQGVGLIETLADRQIKGAEAGTALRNVLLRLAAVDVLPKGAKAQLAKFGVDLKVVGDASLPLNKRLRELGKVAGDASALVKVFGVENFVAGNIVLNNVDRFEELTTAVTGTDEAIRQSSVAVNNLDGDLNEAATQVEAFTLEIGGATQGILRGAVQAFTMFIKILRELPGFIKENKDLFIALGIAIVGLNVPLITSTALTLKSIIADRLKTISLVSVTAATRAFYATLAANPFGLVLIGIAAIIAAFAVYDRTSKRANEVSKQSNLLNGELEVAIRKVKMARESLNLSVEDYIKLSPKEQEAIRKNVLLRKEEALAILQMVLNRQELLKQQARELTASQTAGVIFGAWINGFDKLGASIADYQAENEKAATDPFQERINQLKLEIEEFDNFLKDSTKQKETQDAEAVKKEKDNAFKLRKFRLEQAIKTQQDIEDEEKNGLQGRLQANLKGAALEKKLAQLERDEALSKDKLTNSERQLAHEQYTAKLIEIDKKYSKDKLKLDSDALQDQRALQEAEIQASIKVDENILAFEKSTLQQRNVALINIFEKRQQLLDIQYQSDKEKAAGNNTELLKLQAIYNSASEQLAKDLASAIVDINQEAYRKQFAAVEGATKKIKDQSLIALNEQLEEGLISAAQYSKQRAALEQEGNDAILKADLKFAKEQLARFKEQGFDTVGIEQDIADLELAISENKVAKQIALEEKLAQKKKELEEASYNATITLSQNITAKQVQRLDKQLAALQDNYNKDIAAAGDNERAKFQIQQDYDRKRAQLEQEKNRKLRRQAILEKALAIAKATINTAVAVTAALEEGGPIYAAIVGALGALEIAAIVSTPLPAFKEGGITPGGPVIAGEEGRELMLSPSGKIGFTPATASIINPEKGTRIYSVDDTLRLLALASINPGGTLGSNHDMYSSQVVNKLDQLNNSILSLQNNRKADLYKSGLAVVEHVKVSESYTRKLHKMTHGR